MDRVDSFTLPPKGVWALGECRRRLKRANRSKKRTVALHPLLTSVRSIRRRAQTETRTAVVASFYLHKSAFITNSGSSRFQASPDRGRAPGRGSTGMTSVHPPRRSRCVLPLGCRSPTVRVPESDLREGQFTSIWAGSPPNGSARAPGVRLRLERPCARRTESGPVVAFRVRSPYVTDT